MTWGDSHGVMLDTKGRVFTMGSTNKSRLGLGDDDLEEVVDQPTQVTLGLPEASFANKVIYTNTGVAHSVAMTLAGELYSWGQGSHQRLGVGYTDVYNTTPNQVIPKKVQTAVFDNQQIIDVSCGKQQTGITV